MTNPNEIEAATGWSWWAGPNDEQFTWGQYPSRRAAISNGNGYCMEDGETFWIVEARTDDSEPDCDGLYPFVEMRNLEEVKSK